MYGIVCCWNFNLLLCFKNFKKYIFRCRLLIPSSKRGDSGEYTVHAKNDYGEAEAKLKVTVIGMILLSFQARRSL